MKFKIRQVVNCDLFGSGFYKVAATKDEPGETRKSLMQLPEKIEVPQPYDYIIRKYSRIDDDGVPYFSGHMEVMEDDLQEIIQQAYDAFIAREREKAAK